MHFNTVWNKLIVPANIFDSTKRLIPLFMILLSGVHGSYKFAMAMIDFGCGLPMCIAPVMALCIACVSQPACEAHQLTSPIQLVHSLMAQSGKQRVNSGHAGMPLPLHRLSAAHYQFKCYRPACSNAARRCSHFTGVLQCWVSATSIKDWAFTNTLLLYALSAY